MWRNLDKKLVSIISLNKSTDEIITCPFHIKFGWLENVKKNFKHFEIEMLFEIEIICLICTIKFYDQIFMEIVLIVYRADGHLDQSISLVSEDDAKIHPMWS